jgi:hypothetical protein
LIEILNMVGAKIAVLTEELNQWESVTRGADFPERRKTKRAGGQQNRANSCGAPNPALEQADHE